jgi:hypothetical protein
MSKLKSNFSTSPQFFDLFTVDSKFVVLGLGSCQGCSQFGSIGPKMIENHSFVRFSPQLQGEVLRGLLLSPSFGLMRMLRSIQKANLRF